MMLHYGCSVTLVLLSFTSLVAGNSCQATTSPSHLFQPAIVSYDSRALNGCPLSKPWSSDCLTWNVVSLIMLQNSTYLASRSNQIRDFIQTVTSNCGSDSTLQLYTPTMYSCKNVSANTPAAEQLFNQITPSNTINTDSDPGEEMFNLLMNMSDCIMDNSLLQNHAGVVFLFTDIDCHSLCDNADLFAFLTNPDQNSIIHQVINQRYVMRIMYLTDNYTVQEKDCLSHLFVGCSWAGVSECAYGVYDDINETLASCSGSMMTCALKDEEPRGLTATEIVLVIVIPSGCLVIVSAFCVGIMYVRYKINFKEKMEAWKTQRKEFDVKAGLQKMDNFYIQLRSVASKKNEKWEIPSNEVQIVESEILGKGAFASVHRGILKGRIPLLEVNSALNLVIETQSDSECQVAVKRLPLHADEQSRLDFFNEIEFMQNLGYHMHIISMLGCVTNPWDPLILLEYCHYGDLLRFLRANRKNVIETMEDVCPIDVDITLRIKDLVSFAWQISDGMTYLSSKNFVHRDLAARNILITKNLVAKIGDFGLCRQVDSALYTSKGGRLPIKWMALESLKFYEYTVKSDVWSFAVVMFEVFSLGDAPFSVVQPVEMIEHLEQGNRLKQPTQCPNEIFSLMNNCWLENPEERPCFYKVRETLTLLLNTDSEHYGYLDLVKPGNIRSMIMEQVTKADRTASVLTDDMSIVIEDEEEVRMRAQTSYKAMADTELSLAGRVDPEDVEASGSTDEGARATVMLQTSISIENEEVPSTSKDGQENDQEEQIGHCDCHASIMSDDPGSPHANGTGSFHRSSCPMVQSHIERNFSDNEDCNRSVFERDEGDRIVLRSASACNRSIFVFDDIGGNRRMNRNDSERRIEEWTNRQMTMCTTHR